MHFSTADMYILPYFRKAPNPSDTLPFTQLWLFLAKGGTQVWKTDEAKPSKEYVVREYLEANGLYGTGFVKGDCLYYEVDTTRTNKQSFYTYLDEGVADLECWRPFFWLGDQTSNSAWGWAQFAREMTLGSFGSLERIWNEIPAV